MDSKLFVVLENSCEISHFEAIFFNRSDAEYYVRVLRKQYEEKGIETSDSSFTIVDNVVINKFFRLAAFYRKEQ